MIRNKWLVITILCLIFLFFGKISALPLLRSFIIVNNPSAINSRRAATER
jgi:hypothetical protein